MIGENMVRIGIVGTNFISEWFMAGARRTAGRVEPVAVYSRSAERADAFARKQFAQQRSVLVEADQMNATDASTAGANSARQITLEVGRQPVADGNQPFGGVGGHLVEPG